MSRSPASDVEEQPQWYCRRSGQIVGPVTTAELQHLIEQRSLSDYDSVRRGMEGDWVRVSEIRRAFEPEKPQAEDAPAPLAHPPTPTLVESAREIRDMQPPQDAEPADAAHAAEDALARAARAQFQHAAEGKRRSRRRRINAMGPVAAILQFVVDRLVWLVFRLGRSFRHRIVQAAIAVPILLVCGALIWRAVQARLPVSEESIYAEYSDLWEQIQSTQLAEAGPEDWNRLEEIMTATLDRTTERVHRQANASRPILQELMRAAERLPAAFQEARSGTGDGSAHRIVALHLQKAEELLGRQARIAERGEDIDPNEWRAHARAIYLAKLAVSDAESAVERAEVQATRDDLTPDQQEHAQLELQSAQEELLLAQDALNQRREESIERFGESLTSRP